MFASVKARISVGFGLILLLLVAATIVNATLVSGISSDFDQFKAALGRKSQAVDIDLVMTKVRVRVNQWLRSMNPDFAKQADELLSQDVALVAQAVTAARTEKEKATVGDMNHALQAYIESWRVIQGLYADEARVYAERIIASGPAIRTDLAKLRDDETLDPQIAHSFVKARDDFMAAESLALQYRASLKADDAAKLNAAISSCLAALDRGASGTNKSSNADVLKRAGTAVRSWHEAFEEASKIAQTRTTRLGTWTNKEGEVMAVGANVLRSEGEIATTGAQSNVVSTISRAGFSLYLLSGLIIAIGIALSWGIARSITRPLVMMVEVLKKLAANDLSLDIPSTGRGEMGQLAAAAQVFKNNMIETERLRSERTEVEQRAASQRNAEMNRLASDFETAVGEIIETVSLASTKLEGSAGALTTTANHAREVTMMVAEASQKASTNVQSVASATEEMSSSVNEISRQVHESARIASAAVGQARNTNDRIGELAKAAARIGDVVELINTIAGQTNLLALNATIEAARAGEAGRGFAVVASEVKALAEQTAKATGEISLQISGIQSATHDSVTAIREIGTTIGQMSEIAATIAAAVEEQGAATQEISRNVQQAAHGTQDVSSNIADVQRGANETGVASSDVLSAAQMLSQDSRRLKTEVSKFMNTVRAA